MWNAIVVVIGLLFLLLIKVYEWLQFHNLVNLTALLIAVLIPCYFIGLYLNKKNKAEWKRLDILPKCQECGAPLDPIKNTFIKKELPEQQLDDEIVHDKYDFYKFTEQKIERTEISCNKCKKTYVKETIVRGNSYHKPQCPKCKKFNTSFEYEIKDRYFEHLKKDGSVNQRYKPENNPLKIYYAAVCKCEDCNTVWQSEEGYTKKKILSLSEYRMFG